MASRWRTRELSRLSADAFGASPGVIVDLHVDKCGLYNANHSQHCDIIQFTGANGGNVENRIFADVIATNHYFRSGISMVTP